VFRHVLHEFTAAEHARMMWEAVNVYDYSS
jgi:hypothetical protein